MYLTKKNIMRQCWFCILFLAGFSVISQGQSEDLRVQNFLYDTRMGFGFALPTAVSGPRQAPEGSGFYFVQDEWVNAIVLSADLKRAEAEGRYDIRWDQILLRVDGKVVALMPAMVRAVGLGESVYVPGITSEGSGWYELLSDGRPRLLKRYRLEKRIKDIQPGKLNQEYNFKWVSIDELMVQLSGSAPEAFRPNKKRMLELFGQNASDVEQFADQNGLGWKKEEDVIRLFDFFHQLQKVEPRPGE